MESEQSCCEKETAERDYQSANEKQRIALFHSFSSSTYDNDVYGLTIRRCHNESVKPTGD